MSAKRIAIFNQERSRQRGAALLVMLVILVVGIAAILVNSLTASSVKTARQATTAAALAQAKDALIGYAVSDANRPGELPCPDFDNDGMSTPVNDYSGSSCKSLVGWLPYKALGLPELRDANGEHLWYAVANPFHANGTAILNSDTPTTYPTQMLTINDGTTGATLQSGVIAIVFSPGAVLQGETRSPNDNNATNAIANYLEGSNASPTSTVFQTANNTTINDYLLAISSNNLFPPVETRIAREAKVCLDNYAAMPVATNGNAAGLKYPWAAPVSDITNYIGVYGKYFGRIPAQPNIDTSSANPASTLMTALNTLQAAEGAFNTSNSSANQTALQNAANTVIGLKNSVSNVSTSTIDSAGDYGNKFAMGSVSYATATSYVTTATTALKNSGDLDLSMSISWPATCTILNNPSSYFWTAWDNLVFYQVASGFQPNSSASFGVPLTINGSGVYRATVLVARQALASQTPRSVTSDASYLEVNSQGTNQHQTTPSSAFVTYSPSDPNYATVNDLVLCLDGKGTNPGSVCP